METRLDINRIQRAEASNKKSGDFKVTENRADLLKLQASLPQELERITDQGEAALRDQTEAYEKAKRELDLFQNNVDRQIASLRDSMNSPLAEDYDETEILSEDPEFRTMIAPYDQAVSHEETIVCERRRMWRNRPKPCTGCNASETRNSKRSAAGSDRKKKSSSRRQPSSA